MLFWKKWALEYKEGLTKAVLESAKVDQRHYKAQSDEARQHLNEVLNEYLPQDQVLQVWCWINEYSTRESLAFSADLRVLEKEWELRDIEKELSGR